MIQMGKALFWLSEINTQPPYTGWMFAQNTFKEAYTTDVTDIITESKSL